MLYTDCVEHLLLDYNLIYENRLVQFAIICHDN